MLPLLAELLLPEELFFDNLLLPFEEALLFSGVAFFTGALLVCCEADFLPAEELVPFELDDELFEDAERWDLDSPIPFACSAFKFMRVTASFVRRSSASYSSFNDRSSRFATSFNSNSLA